MRRRLRHGGKPVKYDFVISEIQVALSSSNSVAVAVDNLQIKWQRGHRTTLPHAARVVEKLDQATGELSRTAQLVAVELSLPCTLYRKGDGDDIRWDSKLSHIQLVDADADNEDAESGLLCSVPLELSAYAGSPADGGHRARTEVPLPGCLGSLNFCICSKLVGASDGLSNAGSDIADVADVVVYEEPLAAARPAAADTTPSIYAALPVGPAGASATPRAAPPRDGVEARWQEMYALERSKADALAIQGLQQNIAALIADKRTLSEEVLRLRTSVSSMPLGKKSLAERIAELEAQMVAQRREAVANEERQASAFNSVIHTFEAEVTQLTKERDGALERLAIVEKKLSHRMLFSSHSAHVTQGSRRALPLGPSGSGARSTTSSGLM